MLLPVGTQPLKRSLDATSKAGASGCRNGKYGEAREGQIANFTLLGRAATRHKLP